MEAVVGTEKGKQPASLAIRESLAASKGARVFAYLRVSTDKQDADSQKVGIVDYAKRHGMSVEWVEETVGGAVRAADRVLGQVLLPKLRPKDVLIVAEISRLGRSLIDVLTTLKLLAEKGVQVHVVKSGFVLDQSMNCKIITTVLGLTAEIERDLLRQRVVEGQARARAAGKKLGRPKGTGGYSKLDVRGDEIRKLASQGVTKLNMARILECDWITVNRWLARHGVKVNKGAR